MQNFATEKFRENKTLTKISGFTVTVMVVNDRAISPFRRVFIYEKLCNLHKNKTLAKISEFTVTVTSTLWLMFQ